MNYPYDIKNLHDEGDPTSHPWWDNLPGLSLFEILKQCYPEFNLRNGGLSIMMMDDIINELQGEIGGVGFYLSAEWHYKELDKLPNHYLSVQLDFPEIEDMFPTAAFYKMLILIHYVKNYYPHVWIERGGKPELLPITSDRKDVDPV